MQRNDFEFSRPFAWIGWNPPRMVVVIFYTVMAVLLFYVFFGLNYIDHPVGSGRQY
jgi:hypothetical protein